VTDDPGVDSDRRRRTLDTLAATLDRLVTTDRVRGYSTVFLGLGLLAGTAVLFSRPGDVMPDYVAYWTGGRMVLGGHGGELYDAAAQGAVQAAALGGTSGLSWFVSPPFVALVEAPLAMLPFTASLLAWKGISLALLGIALHLLRPLAPACLQQRWRLVVLITAAAEPTFIALIIGQQTPLVLLLWVAGTRLLVCRREVMGGAVLALLLVKPQLVFLVPVVLLVRGQHRALAGFVVTALGLVGVSATVDGGHGLLSWVGLLASESYRHGVQVAQAGKMQGIAALVTSVVPSGMSGVAEVVGLLAAAAVAVAFLARVRRSRAEVWSIPTVWATTAATTVAVSPHLLDYDLLLILPAALLLLGDPAQRRGRLALVALFLLSWTVPLRSGLVTSAAWPVSLAGSAWSAIPVLVVWWQLLPRRAAARASLDTAPDPHAPAAHAVAGNSTTPATP
jgi:hypothetical protein